MNPGSGAGEPARVYVLAGAGNINIVAEQVAVQLGRDPLVGPECARCQSVVGGAPMRTGNGLRLLLVINILQLAIGVWMMAFDR